MMPAIMVCINFFNTNLHKFAYLCLLTLPEDTEYTNVICNSYKRPNWTITNVNVSLNSTTETMADLLCITDIMSITKHAVSKLILQQLDNCNFSRLEFRFALRPFFKCTYIAPCYS